MWWIWAQGGPGQGGVVENFRGLQGGVVEPVALQAHSIWVEGGAEKFVWLVGVGRLRRACGALLGGVLRHSCFPFRCVRGGDFRIPTLYSTWGIVLWAWVERSVGALGRFVGLIGRGGQIFRGLEKFFVLRFVWCSNMPSGNPRKGGSGACFIPVWSCRVDRAPPARDVSRGCAV